MCTSYCFEIYFKTRWAGRAQLVQRLATGWTVRGSNSGEARFFAPVQTGPGAYPGTGSFPGVKRPGRGVDHPPHLLPGFKKEYSYTSTPTMSLRGLYWGELYYNTSKNINF